MPTPADLDDVIRHGESLWKARTGVENLWQEIGDHFYPERSTFTVSRHIGRDFADGLMTSVPTLIRRDLGNSMSAMLRRDEWFGLETTEQVEDTDSEAKGWLQWAAGVQRKAMYDRRAQFLRATKTCDHDYVTWGQGVIEVLVNRSLMTLLYRSWHLIDCVWCESPTGDVDTLHRRWKMPLDTVFRTWAPEILHPKWREKHAKSPYEEVNGRHVVMPSGDERFPYVSIVIDMDNRVEIERTPLRLFPYVVPRWQVPSGSPYAFSPASICALPDARLIQAMTLTLLEAGEFAVRPPMVAVRDVVRSDIDLKSGGVTWVDKEYDERLGAALRPLEIDKSGIPMGIEMRMSLKADLIEAFFLNKLSLPLPPSPEMTAYEVGQRVQEYIRNTLPLFEPMEHEYNGPLCDRTFEYLREYGLFRNVPKSLSEADVRFRFVSPLRDAAERQKVEQFREGLTLYSAAAQVDPAVVANIQVHRMFREAFTGTGAPAGWLRSDRDAEKVREEYAAQQQAQQLLAAAQQAGEAGTAVRGAIDG